MLTLKKYTEHSTVWINLLRGIRIIERLESFLQPLLCFSCLVKTYLVMTSPPPPLEN